MGRKFLNATSKPAFLTARRRRAVLAGGSVFLNRAAVYCSAFGFFLTARRRRAVLAGGSVFFFCLVGY